MFLLLWNLICFDTWALSMLILEHVARAEIQTMCWHNLDDHIEKSVYSSCHYQQLGDRQAHINKEWIHYRICQYKLQTGIDITL